MKYKRLGFTPLEIKVSNRGSDRRSKGFLTGFTIVELLTVLAIITLLVGLLLPALAAVRNMAKETKQKSQLTTIGLALTTFKNDYGDYPPSDWPVPPAGLGDYCGAQKLTEALLGWDLMGFHPRSAWRADGTDGGLTPQGWGTYNPQPATPIRDVNPNDGIPDTLTERRGPYLDRATANAFRLGPSAAGAQDGLFDDPTPLASGTFVLCDVFGVKKIILTSGQVVKVVKAGTPILYYKANTLSKTIETVPLPNRIYNVQDNHPLTWILGTIKDNNKKHRLGSPAGFYQFFYQQYIRDPKIARPWPYRPDSYILISAGADGEYGTNDDIRNFGD